MSLKLYNTLSRKVEEFRPQDAENVKIYTCGPTVYARAHIGNLCSYIYWDLLVAVLEANDMEPNRVLNFTDVGHLTSDGDTGEDKLEKGAKRENKSVWEVADYYEGMFICDYSLLYLQTDVKFCKATDYIGADKRMIDILTEKGYTYETSDGVYFDTSKFPKYAEFARLDLDHLKAGARVGFNDEKRNVSDFALWKFIQPGEDHAMKWEYRGREGYPGWHLECSVIAHKELGEPLDIHCGGIDHIPVHHTNEIAQTEAAYGRKMCNYWLHCNFITVDGQKISKSLGNTYTLDDLAARGFMPLDFKMWVLQGHYQGERNFSFEDLAAAKNRRLNWQNKVALAMQKEEMDEKMLKRLANEDMLEKAVMEGLGEATDESALDEAMGEEVLELKALGEKSARNLKFVRGFMDKLNDNLNSAEAFALIDNSEIGLRGWEFVEKVFQLGLFDFEKPDAILLGKMRLRDEARAKKDFVLADRLRDELLDAGFAMLDSGERSFWQLA